VALPYTVMKKPTALIVANTILLVVGSLVAGLSGIMVVYRYSTNLNWGECAGVGMVFAASILLVWLCLVVDVLVQAATDFGRIASPHPAEESNSSGNTGITGG
jgi:hypothetical protein